MLLLHLTLCQAISALSGRRNGCSWTPDKAGGVRGMKLTYFKMKNLSSKWNFICQRWALVTCSPAVNVEFLCLCPKHREHTWQSNPALHSQPSTSALSPRRQRGIPPLALKPAAGCQGADRLWTCSLVSYKWDWSHQDISWELSNSN